MSILNINELRDLIKRHEGFSSTVYKCTAGHDTIGYGREISTKGITKAEAEYLLDNDLQECTKDLICIFPNHFVNLPNAIQMVLINMRFQLGKSGFRNFKKMIRAVNGNDLPGMVLEMKDSNWYRQTQNRADDLIGIVDAFIQK